MRGGGAVTLVTRFEDLQVWQEARQLTSAAYELSHPRRFAGDRGLADQLRRAAVSVMNNIAEGFDSGSHSEFRRFLRYAIRSVSEVQSCLYVAIDRGYINREEFERTYATASRVKKKCGALVRRLAHRLRPDGGAGYVKEAPAAWSSKPPHPSTAAPPHRRTPAPPHRRTAAPPHRRTAALPHRRTPAPPHRSTAAPQH
jgi:four helix bundle protein